MENKKLLIGCAIGILLVFCCASSAALFVGVRTYQAGVCFDDAYYEYRDSWNAECANYDTSPDEEDPEFDCKLPAEVAEEMESLYDEAEANCESYWAF